jgi:ribosomal protein L12E/L44/L45/RPP1/RPP2
MSQPPRSSDGRGDDPDPDSGRGTPIGGRGGRRDGRLAWFAGGGLGDTAHPSAGLARVLEDLSGPPGCLAAATGDEATGLLGRWQALDSWVQARLLGIIREMIRRAALPGPSHGSLPDQWHEGLAHEIAAALAISLPAADKLVSLAWELEARLPGTGAKLEDGTLSITKARIVVEEFSVLDGERAAEAEKLLLEQLERRGRDGLTPGKLGKLAQHIADTVDPAGAVKRRKRAEREEARVRFYRDHGGAAGLAARGLPTDQALRADANIKSRAKAYKKAGIYPDATMDQLRVLALCDKLNGINLDARIAMARAGENAQTQAQAQAQEDAASAPRPGTQEESEDDGGVSGDDDDDGPDGGDGGRDGGPGNGGSGGGRGGGTVPADYSDPGLPARVNLTIPLLDLPGTSKWAAAAAQPAAATQRPTVAQRPGEAPGLGSLDPALCRDLASAAAQSPRSQFCLTITDQNGYAIGHACAQPKRNTRNTGKIAQVNASPGSNRDSSPLAGTRPPPGTWGFTPQCAPGPPGGYGTWTLTLPDGRQYDVAIMPVPVHECDHSLESHAYQPSGKLRHLVQIRDGECTFPCCSHPAAESDFEHAIPYDKGGRTCGCNAGARSRRCHRVKQSPGWKVTQPRPGWHRWTTPAGRTYIQGPKEYPA